MLLVDPGRPVELAGVGQMLRLLDRDLFRRRPERAREALDEGLDLALRQGAREAVDRLAVAERVDHRDRLDAQLLGELGALVDVDLDQPDLAAGGLDHALEDRPELLAGPAPGRPEIDDHRLVARLLDDVLP